MTHSVSSFVLPPETLLSKQYRVLRILGRPGGFGITYLAWDETLHTNVAIKEYFPRDLVGRNSEKGTLEPFSREDADAFEYGLEQFLEEARTLARFDHPNVVRVRNFFQERGTPIW